MSAIVSCGCGAKVRMPDASERRLFRCPKCRTELLATMDQRILTSTLAHGRSVNALCPICQSVTKQGEEVVTCPDCDQVHHRECWIDVGGCSTYGCRQAPAAKDKSEVEPPLSAWGDTKKCPACSETIKAIALRCRYCGTDFSTVDPLTVKDLRGQSRKEANVDRLRTISIVLFVASILLGLLGPLMLIADLAVVIPQRKTLAKAGAFYLALGYSSIAISGVFSLLIGLFLLLG